VGVARLSAAGFVVAAFVVQLDAGVVIVGLIPVIASVVTYFLAKHHANGQAATAREAATAAKLVAEDARAQLGEVKTLVDGRYDALLAEIDKRDQRIARLEALLEGRHK